MDHIKALQGGNLFLVNTQTWEFTVKEKGLFEISKNKNVNLHKLPANGTQKYCMCVCIYRNTYIISLTIVQPSHLVVK